MLTLSLLGCGCSSAGPELVVVQGEVTYQGQPIESGDIRFVPAAGSQAPARSAMISQGKYEASGRGAIVPGTYLLEIRAYRGGRGDGPQIDPWDPHTDPASRPRPREQYLPKRYNDKSELKPLTVTAANRAITHHFKLE